jgi:hypothetical protein
MQWVVVSKISEQLQNPDLLTYPQDSRGWAR